MVQEWLWSVGDDSSQGVIITKQSTLMLLTYSEGKKSGDEQFFWFSWLLFNKQTNQRCPSKLLISPTVNLKTKVVKSDSFQYYLTANSKIQGEIFHQFFPSFSVLTFNHMQTIAVMQYCWYWKLFAS